MYRSQYCCILVRCSAVVNDKYNYRPTHFFPLTDVADEARQSQQPQKTEQFHKSNDPQRSTCRHASTDLLATWRNNMLNYAKLCRLWMLRNCLDIVQLGVGRQTILLSLSFSSYFVIAIFSGELFWCQLSIYIRDVKTCGLELRGRESGCCCRCVILYRRRPALHSVVCRVHSSHQASVLAIISR